MRIPLLASALVALAACGADRGGNDLGEAADQSSPAAAAVLDNAAENGMEPQAALEAASAAREQANTTGDGVSLQARPNLPQSPNRKDRTTPPDKVAAPVGQ